MYGLQDACWFEGTLRLYRDADKSLARPASRCILFDRENISFDASLVQNIKTHILRSNDLLSENCVVYELA